MKTPVPGLKQESFFQEKPKRCNALLSLSPGEYPLFSAPGISAPGIEV
jgi:hypothetical protein